MLSGNQKGLQSYTAEDIKKKLPPGLRETDWQMRQLNKQPRTWGVTSEAPIKALILAELPELTLESPKYIEAQNQLAKAEGAIKTEKGWWELPSGKLLVQEELAATPVKPNTPSDPSRR